MSVRVMAAVWERSKHAGGALLMMLGIADHADDSGAAYPGIERLARKARMTPRHARRLIGKLTKSGELEVEPGAGPHGTNRYRIQLPLTNCPPDVQVRADTQVREPLTPRSVSPDTQVSQTIREPLGNHQSQAADNLSGSIPSRSGSRKSKSALVPWPEGFLLTERMRAFAAKKGVEDPDEEFEAFYDWALSKGQLYASWKGWEAGWRTRCRNHKKFEPTNGNGKKSEIRTPAPTFDELLKKEAAS